MAKQNVQKDPRILLTFTGFHDPFSAGAIAGTEQEGPVLSLVRAVPFDHIILFGTPGTGEITRAGRCGTEVRPDQGQVNRVGDEAEPFAAPDPTGR